MQNRRERRKLLKQFGLLKPNKPFSENSTMSNIENGRELHRQNLQDMKNNEIANKKLEIKTYKSDEKKNYIRKPGVRRPIVVINRGYGTGEYKFNHCLIDGQREYLIENHLICIECLEKINREDIINKYKKIMMSFDDKRTSRFIEVYFGNSAINTTELRNVLPIYGYTS